MDDIVESGKPPTSPKPPRLNEPYDEVVLERRRSLLQHVVALALVAIAVSTSIIAWETHQERVARVESRIADCEREIKALEESMGKAGFYDDPVASRPVIDRHQALMWEVGDRMAEWEALLEAAPPAP